MIKLLYIKKYDCYIFSFFSFAISVLYLLETSYFPHRLIPVADALHYVNSIDNLSIGSREGIADFSLSRIYLFLIAGGFKLVSLINSNFNLSISQIEFICYIQSAFCAVGVGVTVWIGSQISRSVGLLSGLFLISFGPFYFFQGVLIPVAFSVSICAVAMSLYVFPKNGLKLYSLILCAAFLGILIELRPHFLILLPVLTFVLYRHKNHVSQNKRWIYTVLFFSVSLLPTLLIWSYSSRMSNNVKAPVRSSIGLNLYVGNHLDAMGTYKKIPEINNEPPNFQKSSKAYADSVSGRNLSDFRVNLFWAKKAANFYTNHPLEGITLLARKFQHLMSPKEFPINYDYSVQRSFSRVLQILFINFGVLFPWAVSSIFIRDNNQIYNHIKLWFFTYLSGLLIFFVSSDHRLPLIIPTSILAAYSMINLYKCFIQRKYANLILITTSVGILSWISLSDSTKWHHHQTYHQIGEMSIALNNQDFASVAFEFALDEKPDYLPSILKLAIISYNLGRYEISEKLYRRALLIRPNDNELWRRLILTLNALGKIDEASVIKGNMLNE